MAITHVGSKVRLSKKFYADGVLTDPTALTFVVTSPDGETTTSYEYLTDAELVRLAAGSFYVEFTPDAAGLWQVVWTATGDVETVELDVLEARAVTIELPEYLTAFDLEKNIGAARVDQLFDDDGDGYRDDVTLASIMLEAEHFAASFLLRNWAADKITLLGQNDVSFRAQVAWVACELASERRGEFIAEDGKGRYWAQYTRAEEYFQRLSKSSTHSVAEAQAGSGANDGGYVKPELETATTPRFVFAPSINNPRGSGGF